MDFVVVSDSAVENDRLALYGLWFFSFFLNGCKFDEIWFCLCLVFWLLGGFVCFAFSPCSDCLYLT